MNRRRVIAGGVGAAVAAAVGGAWWATRRPRPSGPNVVVVLTDDQGFNDLGCYYTPPPDARAYAAIDTPRLDALAASGLRLTRFYVGGAVCTPSRAALLTGCYPPRVGFGATLDGLGVLSPGSRSGLSPDETTLAELFRAAGYHTGCFGKWHLGHQPPFRPLNQGFDEFFGIPWSNNQVPLSLFRGDTRLSALTPETPLVRPFTEAAVDFVTRHARDRFFVYLAHSAPHEPWAVLPEFRGRSRRGAYGDEVTEIDHHVGVLLDAIAALGLAQETIVVFLSDNGPWLDGPVPAGSAWPFRGGKAESFEGGFRSPCLVSWPGTLPGGRAVEGLCAAMDLLPTLAGVCGLPLPARPIDGLDVWDLWSGRAPSPRRDFAYYARGRLEAVTDGRWKRMYPVPQRRPPVAGGLYDLDADPGETRDRTAEEPTIVAALEAIAETYRSTLGDALVDREGPENRPLGAS